MLGKVLSFLAGMALASSAVAFDDGRYNIVSSLSGLYLDVSGVSRDDGANVVQWNSTGGHNQQFDVQSLGDGTYSIRAAHSGKSLDVYQFNANDGAELRQWSFTGGKNQRWRLDDTGGGLYSITSAFSNKVLDVWGMSRSAGAPIKLYGWWNGANQRWRFVRVGNSANQNQNQNSGGEGGSGKSFMGSNKVLVGAINSETSRTAAPFDVQYQYINNVAPVQSCMTSCKSDSRCGGWWGCWQWEELPPGQQYPVDSIENDAKLTWQGQPHPQMNMWTYYSFIFVVGSEGKSEVDALNNRGILERYFEDYRFFLKKIGTRRSIIHLEPDLWGFVRSVNTNPHAIPAQVTASNSTDCGNQENSAAGFSRCLIAMARKYAPNTTVGLHASCWNYMTRGDAQAIGEFMNDLGAKDGDFVVTDPSDRDAGWYETARNDRSRWWDDNSFAAYLYWSKTLSETVGKPTIMWQIPMGNLSQNNTYKHYKDNKIDYLFNRINDVAAAHVVGLMFGPGSAEQTHLATDGGHLSSKTIEYWKSGGAPIK